MTDKNDKARSNLGLVHACCKRFTGKGIEYDELYSAGCLGLAKALNNFDESLGFKFSTYAFPLILGEIKQLFRNSGSLRVSRSLRELAISVTDFIDNHVKLNGTEPTVMCIANSLGVSDESVAQALNSAKAPVSLSTDDEDGFSSEIPIDDIQYELTEKITIENAVNLLSNKDKTIIKLRYYSDKTQSQTAEMLGMTQVQISRREKKILAFIRTKLG